MAILQLQHRCPHCQELKDFVVSQISELRQISIGDSHPPIWEMHRHARLGQQRVQAKIGAEFCALSRCPHCKNPTMFVFLSSDENARLALGRSDSYSGAIRGIGEVKVLATYPYVKPHEPHPTWPPEIAKIFNETRQFLRENKQAFFILAGCRSTLDVVTRKLGATKGNLKERIDDLKKRGVITATLADWAHEIRLDTNASLHEGDTGEEGFEDAKQYVAFIELLLHMSFELKDAIEKRRIVS